MALLTRRESRVNHLFKRCTAPRDNNGSPRLAIGNAKLPKTRRIRADLYYWIDPVN